MDKLLKSVLEGVYIRGKILCDHTLMLDFLTGWYFKTGSNEGEGEPMVFLIECALEDSGDYYGFYSGKPTLSLRECNPKPLLRSVRELWDEHGWILDTALPIHIYNNNASYPGNHLQILETLSCLCVHLRSVKVPDDAMAVEIYAHLADRLEGFIKTKNREYLKTLEMNTLR